MPSRSTLVSLALLAITGVGFVGHARFGWRFDGSAGPVITAVALVRVPVASS